MSSSVAGQIRIDLIAQAAQFKTGMREGRQELGSFQEQFEKFNRAFNSQKSIATRIGGEKDAWGAAMKGLRGEIAAGGNSMLPWYSLERMNARSNRAEDNRLRFQSMADYMEHYDAGVRWEKERKAQKEYEKQHSRELEHKEKQEADEAQEFFRRRDEFKNRLRSPQQIAREELRDLRDNRSNLTAEEYGRGRREIGEKLMGGMGGGEIQPVGMLEAGSAELHSLLAKANMPDPKIALAQRMLVELEKIVAKMDAEDQL